MWLGIPLLALVLSLMKEPFEITRRHWRELVWLAATNMVVWHACMILAVRTLSSGRAAILGYTMPIFSAILGALLFRERLAPRAWAGVAAAAVGVALLLWHEFTQMAGRPAGVMLALLAASTWALGTQLLRRSHIGLPTLTLAFWMTTLTAVVMTVLGWTFERADWQLPGAATTGAIVFNALLIFGFAQAVWFILARGLPPVASTLSVMFIPVLGVFSGAVWLHEELHWQDWTAVGLMMLAIASVLWPARARPASAGQDVREQQGAQARRAP
jgi:drug/metabolite transporter (DMT)-like permease